MPQSRRAFLGTAVAGGASLIPMLQARGMEGGTWASGFDTNGVIRLSSNENPNGPARAAVDAITRALVEANRYTKDSDAVLRSAIAKRHGLKDANVLIGAGSGETLRICSEALTSSTAHLVAAAPTFEQPEAHMTRLGRQTRAPKVDAMLRLDLGAMAAASPGAGLVFLCNPNNPTGTAYPLNDVMSFIADVHRRSPNTYVLVDEAYFEYCDLPGYDTAIPAALADPRIIVARTFSKVFGLAGMRVGYGIAHPDTIRKLEPWRLQNSVGQLSAAAAIVSCTLGTHVAEQQKLNADTRAYTLKTLNDAGITARPTYTNFVMADIRRDALKFQEACAKAGVAIGRPFPPLDTHTRISIGTMDEMKRALPVITGLLKGERA